jgi:tetratricopeptide (TPR) repeat protein
MKAESIVFAVAGMCFGVILGWVLGAQQAVVRVEPAAAAESQSAAPTTGNQTPVLDEARVQGLETILKNDPKNAGALVQLGNTYFDAQRYPDAIKYYEQALTIEPGNVDASTDLGVSYYYSNRPDDALKQFEVSLKLNPQHTKTLLNKGIVLAFGKQDLNGAAVAWNRVVELAPNTPEAEAARRGLEGITASRGRGAAPAGGG